MPQPQIEFDMRGFDEFARRMNEADDIVKITLNDGLRKIGKLFVPTKGSGPLANETPRRTGKLARSSFFIIDADGPDQQKLTILQPAKSEGGEFYGHWVREGRGPVVAKKAKALRFEIDGVVIFRKRVGPAKANPYHKRVLKANRNKIQDIIRQMGDRVTAYIAGN